MSKLKEKIAKKLNLSPSVMCCFDSITPSDIVFYKNGCRKDVIRWSIGSGGDCFSAATLCIKDHISLIYHDDINEIVAESELEK